MPSAEASSTGFGDAARDSQAVFHAAMMAMARPGSIHALGVALDPPAPLDPAAAALCLALCDFETPVFLDGPLAVVPAVADYLRFHTGAPIVARAREAAFAFISDLSALPPYEAFARGTLEYPDRSATLVIQVEGLADTGGWQLAGPGVAGSAHLAVTPDLPGFLARCAESHGLFPRGVDIYFCAGTQIAVFVEQREQPIAFVRLGLYEHGSSVGNAREI